MGLLADFAQFLGSVIFGRRDTLEAFLEPLNMAQRYVRWGEERGDLRDFMSALNCLDQANDEEAPKPSMLVRKYTCYCDATVGAIQLMLSKHRETMASADAAYMELMQEQKKLNEQRRFHARREAELKAEGSLIKAKDEQRRLEEIDCRLQAIERSVTAGETTVDVVQSYERIATEADRLIVILEQAVVGLEMNPNLSAEVISPFREQVSSRLSVIRSDVESINPNTQLSEDFGPPADG